MSEDDSTRLAERLSKLERQMRAWRHLTILIVVAVAAAVLLGAKAMPVPDEVRARRFIVVDAFGKVGAELGPSMAGTRLALYGWGGAHSVELHASSATAELVLIKDAVRRVWVVATDGQSGISVFDSTWNRMGSLSESEVSVSSGKGAANLSVREDGAFALEFVDAAQRRRALLGIRSTGAPILGLYDEDGKAVFGAPSGGPVPSTATPPTAFPVHWVLWIYTEPVTVNEMPLAWRALNAYVTRVECNQALGDVRNRIDKRQAVSCLPDTVDPRLRTGK